MGNIADQAAWSAGKECDDTVGERCKEHKVHARMKSKVAKFSRLYESRDSRLCVFEDEHGHLTSVRTSRLA